MKRIITTIVSFLILSLLAAMAIVYFFLNYGLSPEEQFERLRRIAPLKMKLAKELASNPEDEERMVKYIDLLVLEGNLGRAEVLSRVYDADSKFLKKAQKLFKELHEDASDGEIKNRKKDERWLEFVDWPIYGAFRFAQGYRYAVLGDWQSARNEMLAIKKKRSGIKLNLLLDDQVDYLLARSYQELGQHREASKLLNSLLDNNKKNGLRPRVYVALIESALASGNRALADKIAGRLEYVTGYTWEKAKANRVWGDYFTEQSDSSAALKPYVSAVLDEEADLSTAKRSLEGVIQVLIAGDKNLEIVPSDFPRLAEAAVRLEQDGDFKRAVDKLIHGGASSEATEKLILARFYLYLSEGAIESAKADLAAMNLLGASDETIAEALFFLGDYYRGKRDFARAEKYYLESAALIAPVSPDARWERYLLSKANKGQVRFNLAEAREDLKFITANFSDSWRYAPAVEELLPIHYYKAEYAEMRALLDGLAVEGSAGRLRSYWLYRFGEKTGDSAMAAKGRQGLRWRSFSYYEMKSGEGIFEVEDSAVPLLKKEERTDEMLSGIGLIDLGKESAINAEWLNPDISLAGSAFSRAVYLPPSSAAWFAEMLVSQGIMTEIDLIREVIAIGYPRPFREEVVSAARRHGVDPELIWAIMKKESGFRKDALSAAGALGLMQLMPDTAEWLIATGRAENLGDYRSDPSANIELGAAYIAHLKSERMRGKPLEVIISAYNAGPGNVNSWLERYPGTPAWLYVELIPNIENEFFTKKVIRNLKIYRHFE